MRLSRLIFSGGTRALRELFDFYIPPEDLARTLCDVKHIRSLTMMKRRRLITMSDWELLFPPSDSHVSSESWDISLLLKLLRNFKMLQPPATGWDILPNSSDLSLSADVVRLKYYRNILAQLNLGKLTDEEYERWWEEIKNALLRIVHFYAPSAVRAWEKAIDELFVASFTDGEAKAGEGVVCSSPTSPTIDDVPSRLPEIGKLR